MTQRITREEFAWDLSRNGGALNVHDLDPHLSERLDLGGISSGHLNRVAGPDGQIRKADEWRQLFRLIDGVDHDGSHDSLVLRQREEGRWVSTQSGSLCSALQQEVERYRRKQHHRGIVHLGMREESSAEVRSLARSAGTDGRVQSIRGFGSDFCEQDREALLRRCGQVGIPRGAAEQLVTFATRRPEGQGALFEMGLKLFQIGTGKLDVNRMVLSGHSNGRVIGDEHVRGPSFLDIAEVAALFPIGARRIEHIAVAGCFAGNATNIETLRRAFPGLRSFWGYSSFAPAAEHGSPMHLARWESMTDGDDSSQVLPFADGMVTWSKSNGLQGFQQTLEELEAELIVRVSAWQPYAQGDRVPLRGMRDRELDRYYEVLQHIIFHPELPADRRVALEMHRDEVLKLRLEMHGDTYANDSTDSRFCLAGQR